LTTIVDTYYPLHMPNKRKLKSERRVRVAVDLDAEDARAIDAFRAAQITEVPRACVLRALVKAGVRAIIEASGSAEGKT